MLIRRTNGYSHQGQRWQKGKSPIVLQALLMMLVTCFSTASQATQPVNTDSLLTLSTSIDSTQPLTAVPEYVVIQASDQVTYSSETVASVAAISVKEGSHFDLGDVLLKLDCRVQNADLDKAKAQQKIADIGYIGAKKLKNYCAISDFEYHQAESQKEMANSEVDKLNAIVEKCVIKAPFKGSVAKLMVHLYETVKPGDPLLKIVGTENLDFIVQVPSSWLEWLHIGSKFDVHVNEINKSITVTVNKINPEIDSVSQTVKVVASQEGDADPSLLPGMSGQATFPDKPKLNK
jgi:membrane fusion protein (multidrug efflux system)